MFKIIKEEGAILIAQIKNKGGIGATTISAHIIDNSDVQGFDMDTNTQTLSKAMPTRVPLIAHPTKKNPHGTMVDTGKNTIIYRDTIVLKAGKTYIMDFGGDGDIRLKYILPYVDLVITPINPDPFVKMGGEKAVTLVGKTKLPVIFVLNMIKPRHSKKAIAETIAETTNLVGSKREIVTYTLKDRAPYASVGDGIAPLLVREGGKNVPKGLRKGIYKEAQKEFVGFLDLISDYVEV